MSESHVQLSSDGERRREMILQLARGEARRRRRTRRSMRAAAVGVVIIAMFFAAKMMLPSHSPQPEIARGPAIPAPITPAVRIVRIETDPTITSRLAIGPTKPKWQRINDRELLEALADAGTPAGLIELNGQTVLLPRDDTHR